MTCLRRALPLVMLLCCLVAPLAGAGKVYVASTSATTTSGKVSITIESFSVPNGPELKTSTAGCNIVIDVQIPTNILPDSSATMVRDTLAASVQAQANGYTFTISVWPCWVVEIDNPNTFCLSIANYAGGPTLTQVPARCVFPGETH